MHTITTAVALWARETCQIEESVVADVGQDEEEPERYLVILAARPLEDTDWPWPQDDEE